MRDERWDAPVFGAGALLVAGSAYVGSYPLALLSGAVAWWLASRFLPRGGLIAALAVALLWSNALVVTADRIGAPELFALGPHLVLGALVIARLFVHERGVVATPAFCALLVHGAALLISALGALDQTPIPDRTETFLVEGPILWFIVINAVDGRRAVERALTALVVAAGLLGCLSVVQYATSSTDEYLGLAQVSEEQELILESEEPRASRLSGSIGEKNRYAQILLMVVPLAAALAHRRRVRQSAVLLVSAGLCIAGIALTASRGATVGVLLALVAMVALRVVTLRSLAVLAVFAALALTLLPGYRARVLETIEAAQADDTSELDGSAQSRLTSNLAAFNMFVDHPVIGVGTAGYPMQYESYAERIGLNVRDQERQPHNLYLGLAAETGLIGITTFAAVFGLVLRRLYVAWQGARRRDPALADLAAGWIAAILAYLVSGVFLHLAFERYLWLFLALADATARMILRSNRAAEVEQEATEDAETAPPTTPVALPVATR